MIDYTMSMEKYLSLPGLSSSQIKRGTTTGADFKAALQAQGDETKFTTLGTAVHTALLEPHTFAEQYALQPEDWGPKNVGEGSKKWRCFKIANEGKIVIDFKDAALIQKIVDAASKHDYLRGMLEDGTPEVTFTSNVYDLDLKARTDLLLPLGMADVKTCSQYLSDDNLFKIIFENGYHFQAAHHISCAVAEGREILDYHWIMVSTQSPAVHIRIVKAPWDLLQWGHRDHRLMCEKILKWKNEDYYPGYSPYVNDLSIPDWAYKIYE